MKLTKLERSNKAHYDLMYKATKIMYNPSSSVSEVKLADKKYGYHWEVYNRQKSLKRVLSKSQRRKIWSRS